MDFDEFLELLIADVTAQPEQYSAYGKEEPSGNLHGKPSGYITVNYITKGPVSILWPAHWETGPVYVVESTDNNRNRVYFEVDGKKAKSAIAQLQPLFYDIGSTKATDSTVVVTSRLKSLMGWE